MKREVGSEVKTSKQSSNSHLPASNPKNTKYTFHVSNPAHVLKVPSISLDYLKQIYPYYEKAYLNNEIDYLVFRNYDAQLLMSSGSQYFGTLSDDEVPNSFLDENRKIPIIDESTLKKRRKKLKWE